MALALCRNLDPLNPGATKPRFEIVKERIMTYDVMTYDVMIYGVMTYDI